MQQPTDTTSTNSSPYYQYYQNAAPNPPPPPYGNPPYASAPPVSFDHSNSYSTAYSSYPQNPDHVPNTPQPPPPPQNSFPHLSDASYSLNPPPSNYDYPLPPNPNPNPNPSPNPPQYDPSFSFNSYQGGSFNSFENNLNNYERDGRISFDDGGVYKYEPNSFKGDPARGSGSSLLDNRVVFDDYGRPINAGGGNDKSGFGNVPPKIVKAAPKAEDSGDVRNGVQKFRVKILSEGYGQTDMDVFCQIGLDGIRILDPTTNYTLITYPLDTVTRWEVLDSYIFAFWARTGVDEPKRIRLKSNSYTTNIILDLVTAASIQSKEIGSSDDSSDLVKGTEQSAEKRRGLIDWRNLIRPANEEKDHWVPDDAKTKCTACRTEFTAFNRKHHCRNCGDIFCDKCTQGRIAITDDENAQPVRVCDGCMAEVTQRMSNKEAAARAGLNRHENLARKLQEEMERNHRKTGSKPSPVAGGSSSSTRMREVACPTCTVHLQVQVPSYGSETIECSVCHQPFLVNAH